MSDFELANISLAMAAAFASAMTSTGTCSVGSAQSGLHADAGAMHYRRVVGVQHGCSSRSIMLPAPHASTWP